MLNKKPIVDKYGVENCNIYVCIATSIASNYFSDIYDKEQKHDNGTITQKYQYALRIYYDSITKTQFKGSFYKSFMNNLNSYINKNLYQNKKIPRNVEKQIIRAILPTGNVSDHLYKQFISNLLKVTYSKIVYEIPLILERREDNFRKLVSKIFDILIMEKTKNDDTLLSNNNSDEVVSKGAYETSLNKIANLEKMLKDANKKLQKYKMLLKREVKKRREMEKANTTRLTESALEEHISHFGEADTIERIESIITDPLDILTNDTPVSLV